MNLKHLYSFWKVSNHGGVIRAGEAIHISPQTLSGQIKLFEEQFGTALFNRKGRSLELAGDGKLAYEYADEMFVLGAELDQVKRNFPTGRPAEFRFGVSDAIPKSRAYRLLRPAVRLPDLLWTLCREWRLDRLLAVLALH
ncbi:MAG: LysR family transcriptional regulator [Propionivibrio sp.]|uniref:LysR family transcriptional regulator n=1 Tax=Propionivibrio sp. TaxID=2212460 RepID=UPI001A4A19A5|nr:LysR family transcriptional regulator [Propionivibrio sp.]MBL8416444.1 LysR family transcriptional regulator [Propionivibrio sp.]